MAVCWFFGGQAAVAKDGPVSGSASRRQVSLSVSAAERSNLLPRARHAHVAHANRARRRGGREEEKSSARARVCGGGTEGRKTPLSSREASSPSFVPARPPRRPARNAPGKPPPGRARRRVGSWPGRRSQASDDGARRKGRAAEGRGRGAEEKEEVVDSPSPPVRRAGPSRQGQNAPAYAHTRQESQGRDGVGCGRVEWWWWRAEERGGVGERRGGKRTSSKRRLSVSLSLVARREVG